MRRLYNEVAGKNVDRLAALSDGVFAFALTLLVLDLHVPPAGAIHSDGDLVHALLLLAPRLVPYVMTFMTLGVFWIGQQSQLNLLVRSDRDFTWINIGFLFIVTLMPFSTAFLAEFLTHRIAIVIYWFNILLLGLSLFATWSYALRAQIVKPDIHPDLIKGMFRRIAIAQAGYFAGMLLCFVNTYWSIAVIILVQLNFVIAPRIKGLWEI